MRGKMAGFKDIREDWVYLVVTVLKTKNTYRLRKFKPKLASNEFCYAFKVSIDKNEWFNRLEEVELEKVSPPEIPQPKNMSLTIKKSTSTIVLDRLAGREDNEEMEHAI